MRGEAKGFDMPRHLEDVEPEISTVRGSVRVASAKERVYRDIKASILSSELRADDPIIESEVASRYGISRTPVREALSRLIDEGFIEVVPRKGYFVSRISLQDVLESCSLRLLLEPEAARLAAPRATDELIESLEINIKKHRQHPTAELNREFHVLIARASGNRRLARMIERLLDEIQRVAYLDPYMVHPPGEEAFAEHQDVIDALANRDDVAAAESMRRGLERSQVRILDSVGYGNLLEAESHRPGRRPTAL
jgi:DNA-binding GntR family transcriptional regulator